MTSATLSGVVARRGAFDSKAGERCRGAGAVTGICCTIVFLGGLECTPRPPYLTVTMLADEARHGECPPGSSAGKIDCPKGQAGSARALTSILTWTLMWPLEGGDGAGGRSKSAKGRPLAFAHG